MEHVLGYLARRFTVSEENLATEALTWLLRDSVAREAVGSLVRGAGTPLPDDLSYVSQVGDADTGRPDIVGADEHRAERLIIEAKFAAALTENQPSGYLRRLDLNRPGMLLVVAPSARIRTLWAELMRATPSLAAQAPSPSALQDRDMFVAEVDANRKLALTSWRHLVTHIIEALRATGNTSLAQDADQLLALTDVMDSQAFTPISPGDFSPAEARRIQQLEVLIDGAHQRLRASTSIEHEGRSSHGRIFYGWYVRSRATKKAIWFGFLPRVWAREGISPLWMQVRPSPSWSRQRLATALAPLHGLRQAGVFEDGENFHVPLALRPYLGRDETTLDLCEQVESVVALLDAAVEPGESPTPEVLPDDARGED